MAQALDGGARVRYLIVTLTVLAVLSGWLWMQACHELGHVALALSTGGTVENIDLLPIHLSRTDIGLNPHPLLVAWGGPIVGVLLPLGIWCIAWGLRSPHAFLARYFAGFCLVANGAYIGVGSFDRIGDCGEMLRNGSPEWLLWVFGCISVSAGFVCWNRLARKFGFGPDAEPVARSSVVVAGVTFFVALGIGVFIGKDHRLL